MYPVPGICPVCGDQLAVTRLHCGRCATTLEGLFSLGRFHYLTREQQQFIGIFIKCRGKIKDVEQEMGISYPTVVKLLDELVGTLGFDGADYVPEAPAPEPAPTPAPAPLISPERRRVILDDLSQGRITSAEALRLLQGGGAAAEPNAGAPVGAMAPALDDGPADQPEQVNLTDELPEEPEPTEAPLEPTDEAEESTNG